MAQQEIGETSQAILEDDERKVQDILNANKDRKEPYWIVIFAKPLKGAKIDGKPALVRVFKAYYTKPQSQVGLIIGQVDNQKGTISWEVNMPDVPFGYDALGLEQTGAQVVETSIPNSYVYG